jgi:hypothetical protein
MGTFIDDQLQRKMKESTFELAILEVINCDAVDKYMDMYNKGASKEEVSERVDKFLSGIKLLEEHSKPKLSDDNSSEDNEYSVEMDDELDGNSEDE